MLLYNHIIEVRSVNINYYHIHVGDERTSEPSFWNFWEDPQYFSPDFLL